MTSLRLGLACALTLVLLGACARTPGSESSARRTVASPGPDTPSIYDLDLALRDADGRSVALSDLRDTVRVAAMMYANCKSVCPRITQDMKGIEQQLSHEDPAGVGFVLFSLDPERDSPEALRGFAADHGLDRSRWRLFTTSRDGVRDLAAVLGVNYKQEAGGEFAHSAMILVIDRHGVIRHRQVGLNADPHDLVAAVRASR